MKRILLILTILLFTTSLFSIEMVLVKAGTFQMGDSYSSTHSVTISKDFYLGKYEVTQKEWKAVIGNNPSNFKGDNLPVETVTWYDVINYCNKLSQKEGLTPAYNVNGTNITLNSSATGYRLPTEAQWEYAASGGQNSKGYLYSGSNRVGDVAWYSENSSGITHPVGTKKANELGIYDMSGNVYEWGWDWYGSYSSNQTDPQGKSSGTSRVKRGGSWGDTWFHVRSANRINSYPASRNDILGFRVLRPVQ